MCCFHESVIPRARPLISHILNDERFQKCACDIRAALRRIQFNLTNSNCRIDWTDSEVPLERHIFQWKKNLPNTNSCPSTVFNWNFVGKKTPVSSFPVTCTPPRNAHVPPTVAQHAIGPSTLRQRTREVLHSRAQSVIPVITIRHPDPFLEGHQKTEEECFQPLRRRARWKLRPSFMRWGRRVSRSAAHEAPYQCSIATMHVIAVSCSFFLPFVPCVQIFLKSLLA